MARFSTGRSSTVIEINHIQPDKPQQNAYIERYNRTVRYDWLAQFIFASIAEVRDFATEWLWTYNNERPNMALGHPEDEDRHGRLSSTSGVT